MSLQLIIDWLHLNHSPLIGMAKFTWYRVCFQMFGVSKQQLRSQTNKYYVCESYKCAFGSEWSGYADDKHIKSKRNVIKLSFANTFKTLQKCWILWTETSFVVFLQEKYHLLSFVVITLYIIKCQCLPDCLKLFLSFHTFGTHMSKESESFS